MKEVDVILPCYNPTIGWEKVVVCKYRELQLLWRELVFHLYIVNDGSVSGFQKETINYLKKISLISVLFRIRIIEGKVSL